MMGEPVSAVGRHTCYLATDRTGRWVFTANYTEGSSGVCPVRKDGTLGPATDSKHHHLASAAGARRPAHQ